MSGFRPDRVVDPVCGMSVDTARAEADGRTIEHAGRTYAFCRAGCLRAFREEPEAYAARASATAGAALVDPSGGSDPATSGGGGTVPAGAAGGALQIDAGMRLWYEKCACCLSDAFPEVKAALDAERAAASEPPVDPGICEVAEAAEAGGAAVR